MLVNKPDYYFSLILFFISSFAVANEYVPPPTGPYQSSVVINTSEQETPQQTQVYKFPSADLIQQAPLPLKRSNIDRRIKTEKERGFLQQKSPAEIQHQIEPQISNQPPRRMPSVKPAQPTNNPYSYGPRAIQNYPEQGRYNQWDYRQFPYSQQYPYGYSNQNYYQNDYMNAPFTDMPSPWSVMPMKPFFSGK